MRAGARAVPSALASLLVVAAVPVLGAPAAGAQAAGGSIEGIVQTERGRSLPDVCVELYGSDPAVAPLTTTTGPDGRYRVDNVPAGDYAVGFNTCAEPLPGFAPELYDDAATLEEATPVTIPSGGVRAGVDAVLAETGTISGAVSDQDTGEPLADVCAVALGSETATLSQATTDPEGRYRLENLPAGDYVVVFGDCGDPYTHLTEIYDDQQADDGDAVEPTPVTVASGQDSGGIDAALEEGGAVEGVVTALHTGRQQPLVCVGLFDADSPESDASAPAGVALTGLPPQGAETAEPGAYTLGGVRPGRYVLAVNPLLCGDDGYATSWFDGQATRETADVLTVRKGEVSGPVDVVAAPLPSISIACPDVGQEQPGFSDVPDTNVHRTAVQCMAAYGVAAGRADGSFQPGEPVQRGQLASFLARGLAAAGVALPAEPANAYDDDDASVHELAINQLTELRVISGKGNRRFGVDDMVDRGQLATLLVRSYQKATGFGLKASADRFTDDQGTLHEETINKAATAGLVAGVGDGTRYSPRGDVRRDQAASALARLLDRAQRDLVLSDSSGSVGAQSAGQSAEQSTATGRLSSAGPRAHNATDLRRVAEQAAARLRG